MVLGRAQPIRFCSRFRFRIAGATSSSTSTGRRGTNAAGTVPVGYARTVNRLRGHSGTANCYSQGRRNRNLPTDFERHGLAERRLGINDRAWLLTIDFEAFAPEAVVEWLKAMQEWARLSAKGGWRFSIFLAVEDVVRLRVASESLYDGFLRVARELSAAGTAFHPHNHGVFDRKTGLLAADRPQHMPGYRKRASFAYDVVHRHRMDLCEWVPEVVAHYDEFLTHAGIPRPDRLAFRAGGWDHGDTAETNRAYARALEQNAFSVDSSASSGVFGTRTWRVGAPFGSNVFALSSSLVEIAPCWSVNCDAGFPTSQTASAVGRLIRQPRLWLSRTAPGAFVTVLHFDHLFRIGGSSTAGLAPPATVEERLKQFFKLISFLRKALHLKSATFDDLSIVDQPWRTSFGGQD
jgi:hypothetical protein